VIPVLSVEVKFAVTVSGPLIVAVVFAELVFATEPVQFENENPLFGVAEIGTVKPEL